MIAKINAMDVLTGLGVFVLITCLWVAVLAVWRLVIGRRRQKVRQRLGMTEPEAAKSIERVLHLWHDGKEATTRVPGRESPSLSVRIARALRNTGWSISLQSLLGGVGVGAAAVFVVVMLATRSVIVGICAAAAGIMILQLIMHRRITKRNALFERQLIDALEMASRSLRAGHPLVGAFRFIAEEIPKPVGQVFGEIVQQQALGQDLAEAIQKAAAESSSSDMSVFAASVVIQLRAGGNLADMIDRLAYVIRDRIRLNRRVRVLTAQTHFSKRILLALPILLFVVLNVANPQYMLVLYETAVGKLLLVLAGAGLVLGAWVMNKMSVLRY